jgi:predicted nucleic acid-binding protein
MQKYMLDTNIILHYLRGSKKYEQIESEINLLGGKVLPLISVVTVAEIQGFMQRRNWGEPKKNRLKKLMAQLFTLDISAQDKELMEAYATIHNYSKNALPGKPLGYAVGIQNNDIWIAATAMVAKAIVVTTDGDFDHLHKTYITVIKYPV